MPCIGTFDFEQSSSIQISCWIINTTIRWGSIHPLPGWMINPTVRPWCLWACMWCSYSAQAISSFSHPHLQRVIGGDSGSTNGFGYNTHCNSKEVLEICIGASDTLRWLQIPFWQGCLWVSSFFDFQSLKHGYIHSALSHSEFLHWVWTYVGRRESFRQTWCSFGEQISSMLTKILKSVTQYTYMFAAGSRSFACWTSTLIHSFEITSLKAIRNSTSNKIVQHSSVSKARYTGGISVSWLNILPFHGLISKIMMNLPTKSDFFPLIDTPLQISHHFSKGTFSWSGSLPASDIPEMSLSRKLCIPEYLRNLTLRL